MRSEQEMMELILNFADKEERVRVVGLEGSRANKNVPKDVFQDYDITYVVTDMEAFKQDDTWLAYFGRRVMMQKPEAMAMFAPELGGWFTYLMLFEDGNRIDLKLVPLEDYAAYVQSDGSVKILLDKDQRLAPLPLATEQAYHVRKPSAAFFQDCCNEFWWVSTYVAKGLCRREILYASAHLNDCVRPMLLQMLAWKIGIETAFSVSVGKSYKYMERYVEEDVWERLLCTYRNASYETLWQALFESQALFRETAQCVADKLDYAYPEYAEKVAAYTKGLHEQCLCERETTNGLQQAHRLLGSEQDALLSK